MRDDRIAGHLSSSWFICAKMASPADRMPQAVAGRLAIRIRQTMPSVPSGDAPSAPAGDAALRNPIVMVPARLAATRLPGKPLAEIAGRPMIVHVWQRAVAAAVGPVVVAAGDAAIAEAVRAAGGEAVLTDAELPSGSDRIAAALALRDPDGRHDGVVNLQGDLPEIDPAAIRLVLAALARPGTEIATLAAPIADAAEAADPNVVKAVVEPDADGTGGRALYFSRSPVPAGDGPLWHHMGIYAFRRSALARFVALPTGGLERRERLEQLRALAAGMTVRVAFVDTVPPGVDSPADLAAARRRLGGSAAG